MIYLTRHGETEFNVAGRLQGQCDSPLTIRGRDQAQRMGRTLGGLIDPSDTIIVAGPLGRTRETAAIIAEATGIPRAIHYDADLMEIGMGSWDGLSEYEIDAEYPGARAGTDRYNWFFASPDGENHATFKLRLSMAMSRIAASPVPTRIVVSHGVSGRVIRGEYEGMDETTALRLEAPQDAIFRLADRNVERISTPQLGGLDREKKYETENQPRHPRRP